MNRPLLLRLICVLDFVVLPAFAQTAPKGMLFEKYEGTFEQLKAQGYNSDGGLGRGANQE